MTIEQAQSIPLKKLHPSSLNPRTIFAGIEEMAATMKPPGGIIQYLVARPHKTKPGEFEIVAGHRRHRAAEVAGLADAPVVVRDLTDAQVMAIQIVENLQRENLTALEEGRGYRQLLDLAAGKDGKKLTAEEIAKQVGKSRRYIYNKMKLLDLCEEAQTALAEGKLQESVLLVVSTLRTQKLQDKAIKHLLKGDWNGKPFSVAQAQQFISNELLPNLSHAVFELKQNFTAPGKSAPLPQCPSCPKRAGNMPDDFDDPDLADLCTDPECFRIKTTMHADSLIEKERAKGHTIITGKEAEKIVPGSFSKHMMKGGMVCLDSHLNGTDKTYDRAIAKLPKDHAFKPEEIVIVQHPSRPEMLFRCVKQEDAHAKFRAAGVKFYDPASGDGAQADMFQSPEERKADNARRAFEHKVDIHAAELTFEALRKANKGELPPELLRLLLYTIVDHLDFSSDTVLLGRAWSPKPPKDDQDAGEFAERAMQSDYTAKLDAPTLQRMVADTLIVCSLELINRADNHITALAKRLKVDPKAIRGQAADAVKASEEAAAKVAAEQEAAKSKAKTSTKKSKK